MSAIRHRAASGFVWMFIGRAGQQGVSVLISIVLARLLVPSDFGAVALVMALIVILQVFAEMGVSVAIVQRKTLERATTDSAFALTFLCTAIISGSLIIGSGWIASFFKSPVLSPLIKIAAFSYVFRGIYALYSCILLRDMRYKAVSVFGFLNNVVYGVVAVSLAFLGYGSFSLVYGQVAASVVLLILGCLSTGYVPRSLGNLSEMIGLLHFGVWVAAERVLGSASAKFDAFLVGKVLSMASLGVYDVAQKLAMMFPSVMTGVLDQVMLPIYSKWQDEPQRIENGYWNALTITSLISLPPVLMLYVFAGDLVKLTLGEKWLQVVPVLKIMTVFVMSNCLGGGIFGAVLMASGKPKILVIVNAFRIVTLPICIYIGSFWGLFGVAAGFSTYGLIGRLFNQLLLKHFMNYSTARYLSSISLPVAVNVAVAVAAAWAYSTIPKGGSIYTIGVLISLVLLWFILYAFVLMLIMPDRFSYIREIIKPLLGRRFATA